MRWFSHMHVGNLVSCVNQAVIIPLCRLPEVRQSKESWLKVACFIQRTDCWCYGITHTSSHLGIIRGCVYESPHRGTAPCESLEGWHNQQITNVAHLIKSNQLVRGHLLFNQPSGSHGTSLGLKKKNPAPSSSSLFPSSQSWNGQSVCMCVCVCSGTELGEMGQKVNVMKPPKLIFSLIFSCRQRERRGRTPRDERLWEKERKRERERGAALETKGWTERRKRRKKFISSAERLTSLFVQSINLYLYSVFVTAVQSDGWRDSNRKI